MTAAHRLYVGVIRSSVPQRNIALTAAKAAKRLRLPGLSPAQARNRAGSEQMEMLNMFTKTVAAMALAAFLGTTAAAVAQYSPYNQNSWADSTPLGYSNTARHDPRDTNGD
jgi:hypothetical protein